jgi:glycosyltransferase involved in cell wall biosynthesis
MSGMSGYHTDSLDMRWVLVSGGFHKTSGMGRASYELASYLLSRGDFVEIVSYEIDSQLRRLGHVKFHEVPLPFGSHFLAERALGLTGKEVARKALSEDSQARVLTCGGNCAWPGINWVHSLHHAWNVRDSEAPFWYRLKNRFAKKQARDRESRSIPIAKLVITNSNRTRKDVIEHLGVDPSRVHRVYLGSDAEMKPPAHAERQQAREWLRVEESEVVALFVGALGYDANKGFDTLLAAWRNLKLRKDQTAKLIAAGAGRGMETWQNKIDQLGLSGQVRMIGFTREVPRLLAAGDFLVSPVRYESYGLNVHEAIQRGLPAIVSASAGVAERYPAEVSQLLLKDPNDVGELTQKMICLTDGLTEWKEKFAHFQRDISRFTWRDMARDMTVLILNQAGGDL